MARSFKTLMSARAVPRLRHGAWPEHGTRESWAWKWTAAFSYLTCIRGPPRTSLFLKVAAFFGSQLWDRAARHFRRGESGKLSSGTRERCSLLPSPQVASLRASIMERTGTRSDKGCLRACSLPLHTQG